MRSLAARLRLVHPYPSLLNAAAVLLLTLVAGGLVADAMRLALAMALVQFSIGAFNDVADAPRDPGRVPPKPIAEGLLSRRLAGTVGVILAAVGLLLVLPSGPLVIAIAGAGLGCGLVYDFALSRTSLSWLPLALALPLVPLFAWLGAVGSVTAPELAILPVGILAGGGLAVSNALIDLDVDRAAGRRTVAAVLGSSLAWLVQAIGLGAAVILVAALLPKEKPLVPVMLACGAGLLFVGMAAIRLPSNGTRRLGWQCEAGGVALLAVGWGIATAPQV